MGGRYLSWSEARSRLSQLGLVLVQSFLGSLILRIKEQDTQDIFHSLGQIPHWRQSNRVGWGTQTQKDYDPRAEAAMTGEQRKSRKR